MGIFAHGGWHNQLEVTLATARTGDMSFFGWFDLGSFTMDILSADAEFGIRQEDGGYLLAVGASAAVLALDVVFDGLPLFSGGTSVSPDDLGADVGGGGGLSLGGGLAIGFVDANSDGWFGLRIEVDWKNFARTPVPLAITFGE
jgi:hypothetical protein